MKEDDSFLFLKKNLMKIFFFLNLKNLNISKELKILIFFFWKIWKSWIFSRNWKFWLIFFFFWKIKKSWSFEGIWKFLLKICSLEIFPLEYGFGDFSFEKWRIFLLKMEIFFLWSQSEEDEDGLEMMKIYSWWFFFFFFEKPILWMRITLVGSWCGLLDKSLLNFYKKIISISNGFIHWNELEVLTQCP